MTAPIQDIQRVQAQIRSAFAGLPPPSPENILWLDHKERGRESYEGVRRKFAGRSWMDLDGRFLWGSSSETQPIFGYCYFSAEGFQYYLPPAMLASLDAFEESNACFYTVVGSLLTPSFARLCQDGSDRAFEVRRALFTAAQNHAVCAFLELVFDHLPRFRWTSAKALWWGWKQVGDSAVEKVRVFYHALHHYAHPPVDDPRARELVREIHHAFDRQLYPGDDQLVLSGCGDEPWEYALEFRGADWRTLHPNFLAAHSSSLSFLSDAGFRYFLPAYMQSNICAPEVVENVTFHLTHGLTDADVREWEDLERSIADKRPEMREAFATSKKLFDEFQRQSRHIDWKSRAEQRFAGLTRAQHQVVVHYLEYHQERLGRYHDEMTAAALHNYWVPALQQP